MLRTFSWGDFAGCLFESSSAEKRQKLVKKYMSAFSGSLSLMIAARHIFRRGRKSKNPTWLERRIFKMKEKWSEGLKEKTSCVESCAFLISAWGRRLIWQFCQALRFSVGKSRQCAYSLSLPGAKQWQTVTAIIISIIRTREWKESKVLICVLASSWQRKILWTKGEITSDWVLLMLRIDLL